MKSWDKRSSVGFCLLDVNTRGNRGLTTLEWLLIVAAVAGLAALAVVLVQNVVDETAEEIAGNSARETAAKVAADRITSDAVDDIVEKAKATANVSADDVKGANTEFKAKCDRLNITYSDAEIKAEWSNFAAFNTGSAVIRAALEKKVVDDQLGCEIQG